MNIHIIGNKIKSVSKQKLLGIYIDENLLWTDHIDYLWSTISSKISLEVHFRWSAKIILSRLYTSANWLRLLYLGCNIQKKNLDRLSKLQKRAARIISNASFDTSSVQMFNELAWANITKRHYYNKAVLTYKAINNLTPSYISDLLTPVSQTLNRMLRSSTNGSLVVPRSKTAIFDRSFSSSAPRLWNQLPEPVRKSTSLYVFKRNVKKFV